METKFNRLEEIEKGNPFIVPENYFAQFNEEIMNRLPEKKVIPPQTVRMWDKVKPWVYMAAMFLGLFFTLKMLTDTARKSNTAHPVTASYTDSYWSTVKISEEDFYQYLEDQLLDDGFYDYVYDEFYGIKNL